MTDIARIHDIERTVTLHRRRGDAAARHRLKDEANEAYERALSLTEEALKLLPISPPVEYAQVRSLKPEVAIEAAELLGVRGGILRRLHRTDEALNSYREGAMCEEVNDLPRTYNRVNTLKLALITGDNTVAQLYPQLTEFSGALERRLSTDERAADDAWNWSNLGDVRLLLGDDDGAMAAYRTFADKATTQSPTSTLALLEEIVRALKKRNDKDAPRVKRSLDNVKAALQA